MVSESKRFPYEAKLVSTKDFTRVFRVRAFKTEGPYLSLLAIKNEVGCPRLGISIAKKNISSSVARNRLKRLVRESFRYHRCLLGNVDVVVSIRKGAAAKTNGEIFTTLHDHWLRLAEQCKKF